MPAAGAMKSAIKVGGQGGTAPRAMKDCCGGKPGRMAMETPAVKQGASKDQGISS